MFLHVTNVRDIAWFNLGYTRGLHEFVNDLVLVGKPPRIFAKPRDTSRISNEGYSLEKFTRPQSHSVKYNGVLNHSIYGRSRTFQTAGFKTWPNYAQIGQYGDEAPGRQRSMISWHCHFILLLRVCTVQPAFLQKDLRVRRGLGWRGEGARRRRGEGV
jgi:hypothetical protein